MVKLIVDNYEQMTFLEIALMKGKIKYEIEVATSSKGIPVPYLEVDGVSLDAVASLTWITEHQN